MRISAVTGDGLPALLEALWQIIEANRDDETAPRPCPMPARTVPTTGPDLLSSTMRPRP